MTVLYLFILPNGVESIEKLGNLLKASERLSQDLNPKLQDLVQVYDCVLLNRQFYKGLQVLNFGLYLTMFCLPVYP